MLAKSLAALCALSFALSLTGCGGSGTGETFFPAAPASPAPNPAPGLNPSAGSTFVGIFSRSAGGYNGSSAAVSISNYQFSAQHVATLFLDQGLGTTATVPSRAVTINLTDTAALAAGRTYAIPGTGDQNFGVSYTEADQTTTRAWTSDGGSIRVDSANGSDIHVTVLAAHMVPAEGTANGKPNSGVGSFTLDGHN